MGLADDKHFTNYHRLLNRDHWSPWVLSKLLLALIVSVCLPPGVPLILVIDDTLERRRGSKIKKKHRTLVGWAIVMVRKVRRWQPDREIVLVGDGSYAAVPLVQYCQQRKHPVKLVSRLRLDARLYDFPGPRPRANAAPSRTLDANSAL